MKYEDVVVWFKALSQVKKAMLVGGLILLGYEAYEYRGVFQQPQQAPAVQVMAQSTGNPDVVDLGQTATWKFAAASTHLCKNQGWLINDTANFKNATKTIYVPPGILTQDPKGHEVEATGSLQLYKGKTELKASSVTVK